MLPIALVLTACSVLAALAFALDALVVHDLRHRAAWEGGGARVPIGLWGFFAATAGLLASLAATRGRDAITDR